MLKMAKHVQSQVVFESLIANQLANASRVNDMHEVCTAWMPSPFFAPVSVPSSALLITSYSTLGFNITSISGAGSRLVLKMVKHVQSLVVFESLAANQLANVSRVSDMHEVWTAWMPMGNACVRN